MDNWHTCDTTHCRAGWVVHLAGEKGYALEEKFDTALAASMIYHESSDIQVHMPDFFDSDKKALENMEKLAEEEKKLTY